jgi:hypothetical protein
MAVLAGQLPQKLFTGGWNSPLNFPFVEVFFKRQITPVASRIRSAVLVL